MIDILSLRLKNDLAFFIKVNKIIENKIEPSTADAFIEIEQNDNIVVRYGFK